MIFKDEHIAGTMVNRYKRFLADVQLSSQEVVTAHCPNSGSMKTCWAPGWKACLSTSDNPRRKLKYTLEMIHNGKCWILVNTQIPNKISEEAINAGRIPGLDHFKELRREVKYGTNSRVDLLGTDRDTGQLCYIEVKNVTLVERAGVYSFPDAVTTRGQKHLDELMQCVRDGHRAVMLFVIGRSDACRFVPAEEIDPVYAKKLKQARDAGVELLACQAYVAPQEVSLTGELVDIDLD